MYIINWSPIPHFSNWIDAPACTYNYYKNIITSSRWTRQPVKRIADIANAVIDIFYADVNESLLLDFNRVEHAGVVAESISVLSANMFMLQDSVTVDGSFRSDKDSSEPKTDP